MINKMTPLKERDVFHQMSKHLQDMLLATVEMFQNSDDLEGVECLLLLVDELKNIVEIDSTFKMPFINIKSLLPVAENLYLYIQNQDITGVLDLLQYTLYPITEDWIKGCDEV